MSESIQGHEVMQMMLEHDGLLTRETLIHAIAERLGEPANNHGLFQSDMTIDQLVEYLEQKGKFLVQPSVSPRALAKVTEE